MVKEHLVQGKEFAVQLQSLLQQPLAHHNKSASPHDLILKILTCFTKALSSVTGSKDFSNEFRKKDKQVVKNRRGCYRGKRKALDSWTRETTTTEDEHAWRKYGQKERCYYRCSHKYDQECYATKQVERIKEEEPIIYRTKYFGHHVCKRPQMITTSREESKLQHSRDKSCALDWQDLIPDFSLEGVVSSYNDLNGLDMDNVGEFGDFHFEALEFS
ncbi:hypothetical protein H5410_031730 [Solanum commersonii]|uniref:WRKY domain-containing protein n=1 Tax=Solanum commersonii TaxID=4109 RepID=A0A9J5YKZ5_SOLCO|nr:hypothetical protein H5410_031730 [Solanum commersonii]